MEKSNKMKYTVEKNNNYPMLLRLKIMVTPGG